MGDYSKPAHPVMEWPNALLDAGFNCWTNCSAYGLYDGQYHCHQAPCDSTDITYHRAHGQGESGAEALMSGGIHLRARPCRTRASSTPQVRPISSKSCALCYPLNRRRLIVAELVLPMN